MWVHSLLMREWLPRYAGRFAGSITVSESDRCRLLSANRRLQVEVIPNGVDTQLCRPLPSAGLSRSLIFVGDMEYRPNVDAMAYFSREIYPRIQREVTGVEMWIVGKNPSPEVRQLGGKGVHVIGCVNDLRPYYSRSTVCVVPLRAGGGTRLKILEAMAFGRPVVSTSIGCEGLEAIDGEHLLVADHPQEFADRTVHLLVDETSRQSLTIKARELVVSRYDWDVIARRLMQVYADLAE